MTDLYIQDIAQNIFDDQCIFICGSDLSALNGKQPNNKKIVELFVNYYWVNGVPEGFRMEDLLAMSLQEVAQIYFNSLKTKDIQYITNQISLEFLHHHISLVMNPSATHLLLANLGIRDIYTTNYDNLIEEAYETVGFRAINVIDGDNFYHINNGGLPNVYKLCGTAGKNDIKLMESQFSETDLNRLHYPFMRQTFQKTIVFIGYNKLDNTILTPYVDFIRNCRPRKCYCIIPNESESIDTLKRLSVQYIYMEIVEFISRLRMASLSATFECFNYLSEKRKFVESRGITALTEELNNSTTRREEIIENIVKQLNDQEEYYGKTDNTWYFDYKFHHSLYEKLQNKLFAKDFSELYLRLRTFYSTYQTKYALEDHKQVLNYIKRGSYDDAIKSLEEHLDNAICNARFWLTYINKLCDSEFLLDALQEYTTPFRDCDGQEVNERVFNSNRKILLLGSANTGKTAFAKRQIVLSLANGDAIPIYINCENTNDISLFESENFTIFFINYLDRWQLPSERKEEIINQRVKSGKILLVVDNFSCLPDEQSQKRIAQRIKSYDDEVQTFRKILIISRKKIINLTERLQLKEISLPPISLEPIPPNPPMRNKIFISYSHEDRQWLEELKKHIKPLERNFGSLEVWDDNKLKPGNEWHSEIKQAIAEATIAILLVSPNFLASEFIHENELPPLLERAKTNGLTVFWIPISASFYEVTAIREYQAAYNPSQPLDGLSNADQNSALVEIVQRLQRRLVAQASTESA